MVDRSRRNVLIGIGAGSTAVALGGLSIVGADQHETDNESDDTNESGDAGAESGDTATVRVAHLSPDAPNVDVFVDDEAVLEDVPFKAVSEYLELPAGTYNVKVAPAGEGTEAAVLEEDLEVPAADVTVAAIGEVAGENQPLELAVFEDDNSDPGDDTARVRAVHASPDAPAVDVVVAETGDALFEDLAYGDAAYVEVPADSYRLCVYAAGEREEAVLGVDVEVAGGTVYSVFAVGYVTPEDAPADEPLDAVITVDSEGDDAGTDGTDDADSDDATGDDATDDNETSGDDMDDNATGDDATDDNETNDSDGDGY